jgi:hypothetical protein
MPASAGIFFLKKCYNQRVALGNQGENPILFINEVPCPQSS